MSRFKKNQLGPGKIRTVSGALGLREAAKKVILRGGR